MKLNFPREFYYPKDSTLTHSDDAGNAVFCYESGGKLYAVGFGGKAQKPAFHYRFKTESTRAEYSAQFMTNRAEILKRAQENRAARASFKHDVKIGDIFCSTWGYEQTNVDYYQVTKLCGQSMAEVREIGRLSEETGFMSGSCVPNPGGFLQDPAFDDQGRPAYDADGNRVYSPRKPKRIKIRGSAGSEPFFSVASYASAFRIKPIEPAPGLKVYEPSHWTAYA